MYDIFLLYLPNERCFTFIIYHFVIIYKSNKSIVKECEKGIYTVASVNIKSSIFQFLTCDFSAVSARIFRQ